MIHFSVGSWKGWPLITAVAATPSFDTNMHHENFAQAETMKTLRYVGVTNLLLSVMDTRKLRDKSA